MQIAAASVTLGAASGQVVWTGNPTADTFVTNGTLNGAGAATNYGSQGAITVAGSASGNGGEYLALLKFNLAAAVAAFDAGYGAGNWTISSVTLRLAGNDGTQGAVPNNARFPVINGGAFGISWFSDDAWTETGATYNNFVAGTTAGLGGFAYVPPGNNVQVTWILGLPTGFSADLLAGGDVSVMLTPGDTTVSYLFNSRTYNTAANRPLLSVSAVPEPSGAFVVGLAVAVMALSRFRRRRDA